MNNEDRRIVDAMMNYGGNFVQNLAKAMLAADPNNFSKLKQAFPEYWEKYRQMSNPHPTE
jgi:hypothetical protein